MLKTELDVSVESKNKDVVIVEIGLEGRNKLDVDNSNVGFSCLNDLDSSLILVVVICLDSKVDERGMILVVEEIIEGIMLVAVAMIEENSVVSFGRMIVLLDKESSKSIKSIMSFIENR